VDLKGDSDILKTVIDAVNGIREYLRITDSQRPDIGFGDTQLLPDPIEPPTNDDQPEPQAALAQSEVVIPLPRARPYDEGYMLAEPLVEWGKVTEAPGATPVATIALHPCNKDGTEYASAAHVTVYIKNDRSTVDLNERSWTTSTILSFVRFSCNVGSAPVVVGVLVGEGLSPATGGEYYSSSPCGLWYYYDDGRRCIGWGEWDGFAWNWISPWGMPEPAAVPIPAWGGGVWS